MLSKHPTSWTTSSVGKWISFNSVLVSEGRVSTKRPPKIYTKHYNLLFLMDGEEMVPEVEEDREIWVSVGNIPAACTLVVSCICVGVHADDCNPRARKFDRIHNIHAKEVLYMDHTDRDRISAVFQGKMAVRIASPERNR
jgi:hypothetical protein